MAIAQQIKLAQTLSIGRLAAKMKEIEQLKLESKPDSQS